MDINLKEKVIIEIVIIIIILSLCVSILIYGHKVDCDKCTMKFTQTYKSGMKLEYPTKFDLKVTDLYNSYQNDFCIVTWEEVDGYTYFNKSIQES